MPTPVEFSIGLDLGGTNLRAAAVTQEGALLDNVSGKTAYSAGREAILGEMVDAITILRERCGVGKLAGIGVAVPGFIQLKEISGNYILA
jgi:glucokinase